MSECIEELNDGWIRKKNLKWWYVMKWIQKICWIKFESGIVPDDWMDAVIVPLYKGNNDKGECKNYREISLLSVFGKVYGKIMKDDCMFGDDKDGFRLGRGCVDQVFV